MLVLATAPPHTFYLPISLNSLDREGVRLLSPRDSQITSKTSLQVPMKPCRWRNRAQGGARWRSCSLCCFVSSWSVVEPSWGDWGSVALGVVFFYFGSIVGPWLYLDVVMLYWCIVWSGDCKPTLYLFLIQYKGCVKITPLATLPPMRLCLLVVLRHMGDIAASWVLHNDPRLTPNFLASVL